MDDSDSDGHIFGWLEVLDDLPYYELFGLPDYASPDEIHAAFHVFCDTFHPDRHVIPHAAGARRAPGDSSSAAPKPTPPWPTPHCAPSTTSSSPIVRAPALPGSPFRRSRAPRPAGRPPTPRSRTTSDSAAARPFARRADELAPQGRPPPGQAAARHGQPHGPGKRRPRGRAQEPRAAAGPTSHPGHPPQERVRVSPVEGDATRRRKADRAQGAVNRSLPLRRRCSPPLHRRIQDPPIHGPPPFHRQRVLRARDARRGGLRRRGVLCLPPGADRSAAWASCRRSSTSTSRRGTRCTSARRLLRRLGGVPAQAHRRPRRPRARRRGAGRRLRRDRADDGPPLGGEGLGLLLDVGPAPHHGAPQLSSSTSRTSSCARFAGDGEGERKFAAALGILGAPTCPSSTSACRSGAASTPRSSPARAAACSTPT